MPGDLSTIPQLPPIPPQTPFVSDRYPWERHYPSSSWSTSTVPVDPGRSKSTSPGRRPRPLPVPPPLSSVGPSSLAEVVSPPRAESRSHSHSRSCSRVLVLPSASTAEPIVISPPARTHSRSVSTAMPKLPPRPSTTDPGGRLHSRSKSRPLPLPPPPKDIFASEGRILVRTESLPLPKPTAISAPAVAQPLRYHTSSRSTRPEEAVPMSAPAPRAQTHSRLRSSARPGLSHSDHPSPPLEVPPPIPTSARARAPTPPRPKPRVGLPATPRRQDDNRGTERGRSPQVSAAAMRANPGRGLEQESSPRPKRVVDEFARKWVLEKKGKRLTQDTMVVAQQLRLLR
ncbi:hypothetical protein BV20DRAFT_993919 [Pilatotrama ljubarskyi]|nr:hypothetical protein BV20DRAFT_993919 [Pilatotrama ljubarskyi]